jgi:hypothetical protein
MPKAVVVGALGEVGRANVEYLTTLHSANAVLAPQLGGETHLENSIS